MYKLSNFVLSVSAFLTPKVADISALASWYCGVDNYDKPIVVIIDDLEQCSGDVLGELVMMLR